MAYRSRDELVQARLGGVRLHFLFFWGHRGGKEIGPSCLSQWYPSAFVVDGQKYPSAEHYMMAGKARLFGDTVALEQILDTPDPDRAKALGRKVKDFDAARWEGESFDIVVEGNLAKFSQNPALSQFLLGTGSKVLVEASPLDCIWGIGLHRDDPRASQPEQWLGLNRLGFALMEARSRLQDA